MRSTVHVVISIVSVTLLLFSPIISLPVYAEELPDPYPALGILESTEPDFLQLHGFSKMDTRPKGFPYPFPVRTDPSDPNRFFVLVSVLPTFYDPKLCVEVPPYLRNVSWIVNNRFMNCADATKWWQMRNGASVVDGCNGDSCYGVTCACPSQLVIIDGVFTPATVTIEGIGQRECSDTGSRIRILSASNDSAWTILQLRIDILFDVSSGLPTWKDSPKQAILTLNQTQLTALAEFVAEDSK